MYDDIDSQRCDVNDFRFKENCQAILLRPYEFDENVLLRRLRHSMWYGWKVDKLYTYMIYDRCDSQFDKKKRKEKQR